MSTKLNLNDNAKFRSKPMRGDVIKFVPVVRLTFWQKLLAFAGL